MTACAIYTRKSTEEGLEQEFNSLQAQRDACEAYVFSQKALGWKALTTQYDDGGFSGGNMDRPALKRLLKDVDAGRVQTIVVYKVDRLTRSLSDFAKLVERLDARGASFVSVTQQFNTTTSMGRLTLNVLLSFAQFEREVTGERIRDKVAASKKKGMWMGGTVPTGFRVQDRLLHIEETEAETIREIYRQYLRLGTIKALKAYTDENGLKTPLRRNRSPNGGGGRPFARSHLRSILGNPLYVGKMRHQGVLYEGRHPALVEPDLWEQVQRQLQDSLQRAKSRTKAREITLLPGLVFDSQGNKADASHTNRGGKRYRYYVLPGTPPLRLAAVELEQITLDALRSFLGSEETFLSALGERTASVRSEALKRANELCGKLEADPATIMAAAAEVLKGVRVLSQSVELSVNLGALLPDGVPGRVHLVQVPYVRPRTRMATRLVVPAPTPHHRAPERRMVQLLLQAYEQLDRLISDDGAEVHETRTLHLAFLAPDVTEAIAHGAHPVGMSASRLLEAVPLPMRWAEQRRALCR